MAFIDQKELFEKTDKWEKAIRVLYTDSQKSFDNPKRNFINNHRNTNRKDKDRTGSCALRLVDGVYMVKDYGGDEAKFRNGLDCVKHELKLDYQAALEWIVINCNILTEEKERELIRAGYEKREAKPEEEDGVWYFEVNDHFTIAEARTILSPQVWQTLIYRAPSQSKDIVSEVMQEVEKLFKKYHFYSVKSYTMIKGRTAQTFTSNENFPIFMFDEGNWKKLYKPKDKKEFRFMYYGHSNMPKEFVFGYNVARKAYDEITHIEDDGNIDAEEDAPVKKKEDKKPPKLKSVFMVSGGSDAFNLAAIGQCFKDSKNTEVIMDCFYPVWLNSETAEVSKGTYDNLKAICHTLYNIPDIDATGMREGHELALEYLDIKTVWLPMELKTKSTKLQKDLRDYFRFYEVKEFYNLIKTAYPYKFWDAMPPTDKRPKWSYAVNNEYLYNFLYRNGFCRYKTESEKEGFVYIHINGGEVKVIRPLDVRDYIKKFLRDRYSDVDLINTFHRSNQINEQSLSNLPFIELDFTDYDENTQWMHFANITCAITKDSITEFKTGESGKYIWEEEIIKHKVKVLPDMFTISYNSEKNFWDIDIKDNRCLVFRYLTNASRMYWRDELEYRLDGIPKAEQAEYSAAHQFTKEEEALMEGCTKDAAEKYREKHKFSINGPLLTEAEVQEQKHNLVSKIFSIGHILHRFKSESRGWAPYAMDAKLGDGDDANGGTGKSLLWTLLSRFIKTKPLRGIDSDLTDDKFLLHGVTEHTDMVFVNDCNRYLKINHFFTDITEDMSVNPKFGAPYTIIYPLSPKFVFTSNFPPYNVTNALERRLIYSLYSDYYHYNPMGEYREERTVRDDFGKDLGSGFTPDEWNYFFNFLMQCTKFYIGQTEKISAPMFNVDQRNLKNSMGESFQRWADVYFNAESGKLDIKIVREEAHEDYLKSENPKVRTTNDFSKKLSAWCRYNQYEYNPKELHNSKGRIVENVKIAGAFGEADKRKTVDMIYIKSKPVLEAVVDRANEKQGIDFKKKTGDKKQVDEPF